MAGAGSVRSSNSPNAAVKDLLPARPLAEARRTLACWRHRIAARTRADSRAEPAARRCHTQSARPMTSQPPQATANEAGRCSTPEELNTIGSMRHSPAVTPTIQPPARIHRTAAAERTYFPTVVGAMSEDASAGSLPSHNRCIHGREGEGVSPPPDRTVDRITPMLWFRHVLSDEAGAIRVRRTRCHWPCCLGNDRLLGLTLRYPR